MIKMKGEYMVCLPGPHGTEHNVIFRPTAATVEAIRAAATAETPFEMEIADAAGEHVSDAPRYISGVRHQYDTLIFITNR